LISLADEQPQVLTLAGGLDVHNFIDYEIFWATAK
jgi:hypothetical protein